MAIRFPVNATYSVGEPIDILRRQHVVIDGRGSTFNTTTQSALGNFSQIMLFKSRDVIVRNMNMVGNFNPDPALYPRRQTMTHYCEAQAGIAFYGGIDVTVEDSTSRRPCGDGFGGYRSSIYSDNFLTSEANEVPTNLTMQRLKTYTPARMCFGPTQVKGFKGLDNYCEDAWYGGIDIETDERSDVARGIVIARNRFVGFNLYGVLIPVGGPNREVGDIEIYDNVFETPPDNVCLASIAVGVEQYSNTLRFDNVRTFGNRIKAFTTAVLYDNVDGGSISGNTVTKVPHPSGAIPEHACGHPENLFKVVDSTNVTVSGNTVQ